MSPAAVRTPRTRADDCVSHDPRSRGILDLAAGAFQQLRHQMGGMTRRCHLISFHRGSPRTPNPKASAAALPGRPAIERVHGQHGHRPAQGAVLLRLKNGGPTRRPIQVACHRSLTVQFIYGTGIHRLSSWAQDSGFRNPSAQIGLAHARPAIIDGVCPVRWRW